MPLCSSKTTPITCIGHPNPHKGKAGNVVFPAFVGKMTHSSNRSIRKTIRNIEAAAPMHIAIKIYVGSIMSPNSALSLVSIGNAVWQYIIERQKDVQHIDIL